mgnify:CR=1 FL=1
MERVQRKKSQKSNKGIPKETRRKLNFEDCANDRKDTKQRDKNGYIASEV